LLFNNTFGSMLVEVVILIVEVNSVHVDVVDVLKLWVARANTYIACLVNSRIGLAGDAICEGLFTV
jgi:hypothetical protein